MNRSSPRPAPARRRFLALSAALFLLGCASVSSDNMQPTAVTFSRSMRGAAAVRVVGGVEATFGGMEEVPIESFAVALRKTIDRLGPFAGVAQRDGAEYELEVTVYPMVNEQRGLTLKQKLSANWKLTRTVDGAVVFQRRIDSEHESDAFAGATRMVLTTEGASRKNIEAGLEAISRLEL